MISNTVSFDENRGQDLYTLMKVSGQQQVHVIVHLLYAVVPVHGLLP